MSRAIHRGLRNTKMAASCYLYTTTATTQLVQVAKHAYVFVHITEWASWQRKNTTNAGCGDDYHECKLCICAS